MLQSFFYSYQFGVFFSMKDLAILSKNYILRCGEVAMATNRARMIMHFKLEEKQLDARLQPCCTQGVQQNARTLGNNMFPVVNSRS
jgi:hypothetical protein